MRTVILVIALAFLLYDLSGQRMPHSAVVQAAVETQPTSTNVDFDSQIKPIFQSKCMPCHFSGGKMYESLPFDRPETIKKLGTKLFSRIKDENHRRLIRDFLAQ